MRRYLIYFSLILASCNSPVDRADNLGVDIQTIPEIQLPFKIRCDQFPGIWYKIFYAKPKDSLKEFGAYYGKILKGDLTILIKNTDKILSPILYTLNNSTGSIDSLILFDRQCYIGTDCDYLPWITITKDLTIIRTDTSYSTKYNTSINPFTKTDEIKISIDSTITTDVFKIDNFGKINKSK